MTEKLLRAAAARAGERLAQAAALGYDPAQPYEPSDAFARKLRRLFRRARHPYLRRALQRVAAVFLAALIAGAAWLAVDARAREAFFGWIVEIREHSVNYYAAPNHASTVLPRLTLTWLPDGLGEPDVYEDDTMYNAVYENPATGDALVIEYCLLTEETQTEYFTTQPPERLQVNGASADFYAADGSSDFSNLIWIDPETGVLCAIDGSLNKEDILHIAEGMILRPAK